MNTILVLSCVLALLLVITAQLVRARVKTLAVAAAIFAWLGVWGLHRELPGGPKSVLVETADVDEAEVLWASVTGDRIYLMLIWPGLKEPQYYWMAKTQERAKQLQQSQAESRAMRRSLMVRQPFGAFRTDGQKSSRTPPAGGPVRTGSQTSDNDRDESIFYAPPPPPLPTKE